MPQDPEIRNLQVEIFISTKPRQNRMEVGWFREHSSFFQNRRVGPTLITRFSVYYTIYIYIYILDRTCCFQQQRLQCIMQNCRKASLHQICHHCLAICPEFCLEICPDFVQIWTILPKFEQFCPKFGQIWPNLKNFA